MSDEANRQITYLEEILHKISVISLDNIDALKDLLNHTELATKKIFGDNSTYLDKLGAIKFSAGVKIPN